MWGARDPWEGLCGTTFGFYPSFILGRQLPSLCDWVGGKYNPFQYSCLEIPWTEEPGKLQSMGSQSWTQWSDWAQHNTESRTSYPQVQPILLLFSHSVVSNSLQPHGLRTPCFPVHHQLPELTQTHVHWVSDVILSSHLILCHPLFLLPSVFPSIRVFSSESALRIRWPKNWSHSAIPPILSLHSECFWYQGWKNQSLMGLNYQLITFWEGYPDLRTKEEQETNLH